jgi:hypothetical protein
MLSCKDRQFNVSVEINEELGGRIIFWFKNKQKH